MSRFYRNSSRFSSLTLAVLTVLSLPGCAAKGQSASGAPAAKMAQDPAQVVAVVDGKNLTSGELLKDAEDQLLTFDFQYQKNRHDLIEGAMRQAISERLLADEMKATGKTREQLAADIKVAPVTDAQVDAFYQQNLARMGGQPKEAVAPRIHQFLEQQGMQEAQKAYLETLWKKHGADLKLDPFRAEIAPEGPAKGPASAPVTIVEFSDFQCPFCSQLIPTLEQVKAKYGDKVRIVFRMYPLPFHQNAAKAAEAALCANEQGKFWELHDVMFKNQNALGVEDLKKSAASLGLNSDEFGKCLDSGKTAATVQSDMKDGSTAGVSGTPAMFINGRFISGAVPIDQITSVIDDELRRKGAA